MAVGLQQTGCSGCTDCTCDAGQAELIRCTLEMDPTLSVPAILREAALLVGTKTEGPLLVQACDPV